MGLTLLNQLGEWNPQLFRELKGHIKPRNLFLTVFSSLACQFIIVAPFFDWQTQWQYMFRTLNWIVPFFLLIGGVHLLISDLDKESRRGTLNFIRLSPQSTQSILLGKMLGVPALLYLAIALAIPLHMVSALGAGLPLGWLLGIYALWGVGCCLFYCAAFYYTLVLTAQSDPKSVAWVGSFLACFLGLPYISIIDFSFDWYKSNLELGNWHWFLLPLDLQPQLMFVWVMITLSVATYWIWQAANRLFTNPTATHLSKRQSYWLVASSQVWLLGFVIPQFNSVPSNSQVFIGTAVLFFLNPIGFLVLNGALSPRRQALLDWARYRHKSSSTRKGFFNFSLRQDLIGGEKSPAIVAIAINFLISVAIWIPWIILVLGQVESKESFTSLVALLGLLLTMNVILIYAAISQVMLFMNQWQRVLWIVGTVGVLVAVPLAISATLGITLLHMPFVWLLSPLPILALTNASATTIVLGLLAQFSILGLLTRQLTRQLRHAGESDSKALFTKNSSLPIGSLK